jgi:hypothetical protein
MVLTPINTGRQVVPVRPIVHLVLRLTSSKARSINLT